MKEAHCRDAFDAQLRESQARFASEIKQTKVDLVIKYKKDYGKQFDAIPIFGVTTERP